MLRLLLSGLFTALMAAPAFAGSLRLPAVKDNSVVMVDGEWELNGGQQGRIRIKGNQHIVVMAFDTSAIVGKRVSKATLVCAKGEQTISGVTISTIATPWDEYRANGLTAGIDGIIDWGYTGAKFPAVAGGNSFTLTSQTASDIRDDHYHWNVPPDLIHAMAIGVAHGLAIHEHDSDVGRNPTIFAREQSGKSPYLLVEVEDQPDTLSANAFPVPPTNLRFEPGDGDNSRLSFTPPESGFAYEVLIAGKPLGRHNIPLVSFAETQSIRLRDLPEIVHAGDSFEIEVVTINRTGQRAQAASIRGSMPNAVAIPKPLPANSARPLPAMAGLSVIPVTDKYDATGTPVGDLPEDYRNHNAIFDGQRIRLTAAAGEVAGFQMLLRGTGTTSIDLTMEDSNPGPGNRRPQLRVDLYQAVYVLAEGRQIPDPLLPLPQHVELRTDADTSIVADIFVPFDASPGKRTGRITLADGRAVPLEIEILPFAIPRQATFFCEMNGYGLPDHVDDYYALQEVAYDHRVHANILHYSHNTAAPGTRKSNLDMRLPSGRRMDNKRYDNILPDAKTAFWDDFVEAFGPYIDGSLFKDGHRGPVAAPGFYLTFHESWPLNCRAYFNGNPDAYLAFADHPAYAQTYVNILQDFAALARSKGWTQTGFQVYFNNKGSLHETSKAPWILDEPSGFWDYRALQFYGELTDRGRSAEAAGAAEPGVQISYRIDISRPEFCRSQLDHRGDLWVVSSWAFQNYRRLVTDRMERDGLRAWVYGTSNHVHESNRNIQAWALDAWQHGATGIVPWQTINKSGSALQEADQLGLFIFDKGPGGETVIRHSLRLKAYREAQQLIEYLNLLRQQQGWSQDHARDFVRQYLELRADVVKVNEADAGTTAYGGLSSSMVDALRRDTARMLSNSDVR